MSPQLQTGRREDRALPRSQDPGTVLQRPVPPWDTRSPGWGRLPALLRAAAVPLMGSPGQTRFGAAAGPCPE